MLLFESFLFHSKDKPQDLVDRILQRKDFEYSFADVWFDLFSGRRDKFRFQADESVYLKVQLAIPSRRRSYLKGKMIFRIRPGGDGSEVKVLLRPDLFWTYGLIFSVFVLVYFFSDPSAPGDLGLLALFLLAYGWSGFSFYKQKQLFENYIKRTF
jgi:hypothetical protein